MSPTPPSEAEELRAERMEMLRSILSGVYTPEGVDIWLNHHHLRLGHQLPVDLIDTAEGYQRVLMLAYSLHDGPAT